MGVGYVRQSSANILTGNVIEASDLNAEYNAIENAFNSSTGHSHDGTTGEGPKIDLTTSVTGVLPITNGGTGFSSLGSISTKTTPIDADSTVIVDSADSNNPKRLTFSNLWTWAQSKAASSGFTSVVNSGNSTVGGTLGVTGATTLSSTLGVTGVATFSNNVTVGGTLGVTGSTTLAGLAATSLSVSGATNLSGTLGVTGTSTLAAVSASSLTLTTPLAIAQGGTGSTTAAAARTALFGVSTTTDNAIARYDGTTGSLQNSGVIISDANGLYIPGPVTGGLIATTFSDVDNWNSAGYIAAGMAPLLLGTAPNGPGTSHYYYPVNFNYSTSVTQLAVPYQTGAKIHFRTLLSGVWSDWQLLPNIPATGAYYLHAGRGAISEQTASGTVSWNGVSAGVSPSGNFSGNTTYTIPETGRYLVHTTLLVALPAANDWASAHIRVNGSPASFTLQTPVASTVMSYSQITGTVILNCTLGDTITVYANLNATATIFGGDFSAFTIIKIG